MFYAIIGGYGLNQIVLFLLLFYINYLLRFLEISCYVCKVLRSANRNSPAGESENVRDFEKQQILQHIKTKSQPPFIIVEFD
jgi:hypothetical protein